MKKNKAKKTAAKVENDKKFLYLKYTEYRTGGDCVDPDDRWSDRTDETVDWNLVSCSYIQEEWPSYTERVEINFDAHVGSKVYVVYVRYGTGDTFGHTDGCWTIIGIYEHREEAVKIVKSIENGTYNGYKCWEGYFESLQSCEYEEMTVEGNSDWYLGAFE